MNREILRLAIPNIISNISIPLLSTVDTALMGRLSELHIGAVGVGAMIFNFIYWNFGFLRMGTTGMTAQAYGKQDNQAAMNVFGRAFLVSMILAFSVMALQVPLGKLSFYLMNVSESQIGLVEDYFYIRIWAAPATLALYGFMGWFFGMQNAIFPLILTVVINVVNIVLSFFFVHYLEMDVDGVAWGTVLAQYTGLLLAIILFFYKYRQYYHFLSREAVLKWNELKKFLSINADIFIRTFFLTFVFGFFYSQSSANGEMILAVNVILLQFLNWMSYGVDGFAYASESLVGKYAGANDERNTRKAIRYSFIWGMALALGYSLLYGLGGKLLLSVFTNQADVITAAKPYLFWMFVFPLLSTPCYIWDGVFIGLTAAKSMRNSMLLAFILFLGSFFLIGNNYGNHGLWLILLIFMVSRGLFQQLLYWQKGIKLA